MSTGETMAVKEEISLPVQGICTRCNFVSSQAICKACVLLEGLNKGLPRLGVGKSSKAKKMLDEYNAKKDKECLENAVNDADDDVNFADDSCKSKGKPCRTGLCKNNRTTEKSNTNCCKENDDTNGVLEGNSKIKNLLRVYGIEHLDSEKVRMSKDTDPEKEKYKATNSNSNSDNEDSVLTGHDEDNTCAGTCGTIGSLNIGF